MEQKCWEPCQDTQDVAYSQQWQGVTPECRIDLYCRYVCPSDLTCLKTGVESQAMAVFLHWRRHEVAELSGITAAQLLTYDFDRTRRAMQESSAYRTVSSLASASPACFQGNRDGVAAGCPWQCGEVGHWHHIALGTLPVQ